MSVKVEFTPAANWERKVANATAEARGAKEACASKAREIESGALAALAAYDTTKRTARLANLVRDRLKVLPAGTFVREQLLPGTKIDVALVVSDSKFSGIVEYGGGPRTPATRFMTTAAWSGSSTKWEFHPRGRRRS